MRVYRICPEEYAEDLSGNGAKLYGGRWNSEGLKALYTASTRSLALLEVLVHANFNTLQERSYYTLELDIPDGSHPKISLDNLSAGWNDDFVQSETVDLGNQFLIQKKNLFLAVPSVIIPEETNYVLNPLHKDYDQIKIVSLKKLKVGNRISEVIK